MKIAPTTIVIFGVTGDLANRYLLPSLFDLHRKGMLPEQFRVVGFSRRPLAPSEFEELVLNSINKKEPSKNEAEIFLAHTQYQQGNFDEQDSYLLLAQTLEKIDKGFGQCSNKLFHLSVPPNLYEGIVKHLSDSGLTIPCGGNLGWTRVLLEKPFGNDSESAARLDALLGKLFKEEQIFRIDHYLAKESVQNILAFRFANALFEPLWNKKYIESVSVMLYEKLGLEGRGATYDGIGMLRDVGQNHVLQMMALIAMDAPEELSPDAIRIERAKVFKKLLPFTKRNIQKNIVRAQYEGFREEKNVQLGSETETFFRINASVNSPRWKGVPFYLEAGKALGEYKAEIKVTFKETKMGCKNVLTFRIQPDESITLAFFAKKPGLALEIEEKKLSYFYRSSPNDPVLPNAYEKVLFDCIRGDQTLFASTQEIAASWKYITPILKLWKNVPLVFYKKGAEPKDIQ